MLLEIPIMSNNKTAISWSSMAGLSQMFSGSPWYMTDAQAGAVVPIMGYWTLCILYEACDYLDIFPQYRVYPSPEEQKRNLVSRSKVLGVVLLMQAVQISFALYMTRFDAPIVQKDGAFGSLEYFQLLLRTTQSTSPSILFLVALSLRLLYLAMRQLLAFFIFDTW